VICDDNSDEIGCGKSRDMWSYHLISRNLPHPISSELSSQSLSPSHLCEGGIELPLSHVNSLTVKNVHVYKFIYYLLTFQIIQSNSS
jgi:hypothetical protein